MLIVHYVVPFIVAPGVVLLALVLMRSRRPVVAALGTMLAGGVVGFAIAVLFAGGTLERLLS
jgi:hypothetical protein